MTNQEIFDIVARHLLKQGAKSEDTETCLYRGPNGLKCAVGVLIPDAYYLPAMEGRGVDTFMDRFHEAGKASGITHESLPLLRKLQACHDEVSVPYWPVHLSEIADLFGLTMPTVEQAP